MSADSGAAAGAIEQDAAYMDKMSRMIATFGIDTMGALLKLKGTRATIPACLCRLHLCGPQ